jgi:hypothetical protein
MMTDDLEKARVRHTNYEVEPYLPARNIRELVLDGEETLRQKKVEFDRRVSEKRDELEVIMDAFKADLEKELSFTRWPKELKAAKEARYQAMREKMNHGRIR